MVTLAGTYMNNDIMNINTEKARITDMITYVISCTLLLQPENMVTGKWDDREKRGNGERREKYVI